MTVFDCTGYISVLFTNSLVDGAYTNIHEQKIEEEVKKPTIML